MSQVWGKNPISLWKESLSFAGNVGHSPPSITSHVGCIDVDKIHRCRIFKLKFPCSLCKGYHITYLCPDISVVPRLWSESKYSSTTKPVMVSQQSTQPLVDEVVNTMQSLADPTPLFRVEVSTNKVFLISSLESFRIWGMPFSSNLPPPSSRNVSFECDNLVEPRLPYFALFQIKVKLILKIFYIF